MGTNSFEVQDLDVYKESLGFMDKIYDLFVVLPYMVQNSIGNNLLKASVSIANNITEENSIHKLKTTNYKQPST